MQNKVRKKKKQLYFKTRENLPDHMPILLHYNHQNIYMDNEKENFRLFTKLTIVISHDLNPQNVNNDIGKDI